jgi:hypothetical protein
MRLADFARIRAFSMLAAFMASQQSGLVPPQGLPKHLRRGQPVGKIGKKLPFGTTGSRNYQSSNLARGVEHGISTPPGSALHLL